MGEGPRKNTHNPTIPQSSQSTLHHTAQSTIHNSQSTLSDFLSQSKSFYPTVNFGCVYIVVSGYDKTSTTRSHEAACI